MSRWLSVHVVWSSVETLVQSHQDQNHQVLPADALPEKIVGSLATLQGTAGMAGDRVGRKPSHNLQGPCVRPGDPRCASDLSYRSSDLQHGNHGDKVLVELRPILRRYHLVRL